MKLKYTFETMQLDDNIIAIPIGKGVTEFQATIRLNDTGAEIFKLLEEDTSEDVIVSKMLKLHGGSYDETRIFVHEFIEGLKKESVLV